MPAIFKFKCYALSVGENGDREIYTSPVKEGPGDDSDFASVIRGGEFKTTIASDSDAINFFELGKKYYIMALSEEEFQKMQEEKDKNFAVSLDKPDKPTELVSEDPAQ